MKFFTNKETTKKVIIAILLVMSFNFISPATSQAFGTPKGGKLFEPLFQLTCGIADLFIKGMQKIFMGYGDIKSETNIGTSTGDTEFNILYSPGAIFSNRVPALDVNFFNPNKYDAVEIEEDLKDDGKIGSSIVTISSEDSDEERNKIIKEGLTKAGVYNYGYDKSSIHKSNGTDFKDLYKGVFIIAGMNPGSEIEYWEYDGKIYALEKVTTFTNYGTGSTTKYEYYLHSAHRETKTGEKRESSAATLQDTIATWYKALRAFALVGLLSVLVYIGIRILISSTGQEKSKYKKMVIDWVAAICILFVLQYIMIFTLKITESITNILSVQVIGDNGRDDLMSDLRGKVGGEDETKIAYTEFEIFIHTIMYIALVIETGIFSVHYLKRLVYMAFFTMIAPLIALTYPLDKIKDGQAQAFGTWIREYIFNALIQPVHLLLYYIFITSAINLASGNPLYAVVALGFMMPAEKFFRKMFGFEKASSVSQVGAAAGGALVMNAINKMGQNAGKQAAGKVSGGSAAAGGKQVSGTRTADGTALNALTGGSSSSGNSAGGTSPLGGNSAGGSSSASGSPVGGAAGNTSSTSTRGGRFIKGVGNLAKNQTFTKAAAQRNLRAMAGIAGGVMGTTIGLGAGIATGDIGKAMQYGAAGAGAGFMGGKGLVNAGFNTYDSAVRGIDNIAYDYQTGALGEEEANNRKFDREFRRSEDYKKMLKNYGNGAKGNIQQMLNAGITDPTRMNTILKSMNKYGTDLPHAMAYNQLANDCSDSILYDDKKLRMFLNKRGITNTSNLDNLRQSIIDFK